MPYTPHDEGRVTLESPEAIAYWTARFRIDETKLNQIIAEKGNAVWAIENYLEMEEE